MNEDDNAEELQQAAEFSVESWKDSQLTKQQEDCMLLRENE